MKHALAIVLAVSLVGIAVSATLTFRELFTSSAAICLAPGAPGTMFGYPACVSAFFAFLLLAIAAGCGLLRGRSQTGTWA